MSRDILINLIDPDPNQPRKYFEEAKLQELAQSLESNGLAVPILLRPDGDRFIIVHGERRYKAAQLLGWQTIPAEVREVDVVEAGWLSLVENVQRSDLSPIEEAQAYKERLATGITQEQLGQRIGKTQSYIAQKLRLLTLSDPIRLYLDRGAITEGHARQLLKLKAIYTEDLHVDFTEWAEQRWFEKLSQLDAWRVLSFFVLRDIRPEDNPKCWFFLMQPAGPYPENLEEMARADFDAGAIKDGIAKGQVYLIAEGCKLFDRYVCENEGEIPQWEVAAFWWASAVVYDGSLGVAQLSKQIDFWEERFLSALGYCELHKNKPESKSGYLDTTEFWGYNSDLRHSNALEMVGNPQFSAKKSEALRWVLNNDGWVLPSSCQPWGFQYEKYSEELAKWRAKQFR